MGCSQYIHFTTISLVILVISSSADMRFYAQGRKLMRTDGPSQTVNNEKMAILRAQIGSRPPRCERRCGTCGHCEAIQVPTNPQIKSGTPKNATTVSSIAYARGEDNSNYKPMSWKCKCGNLIFNP